MRRLIVALAASAVVFAAVPAMAVTFDFSFTNVLYGGGLVEGTVSNLVDNATGPGDVRITSNAGGFGVGAYDGNPFNSFTLSAGSITQFDYEAFGVDNADPATGCCSLAFSSSEGAGLSDVADEVAHSGEAALTFTAAPGPAPIPLPAPVALLAVALAMLAAVARRPLRAIKA